MFAVIIAVIIMAMREIIFIKWKLFVTLQKKRQRFTGGFHLFNGKTDSCIDFVAASHALKRLLTLKTGQFVKADFHRSVFQHIRTEDLCESLVT